MSDIAMSHTSFGDSLRGEISKDMIAYGHLRAQQHQHYHVVHTKQIRLKQTGIVEL